MSKEKIYSIFGVTRQGYHAWLQRQIKKPQKQVTLEKELLYHQTYFKEIIQTLGYVPGKRTFRLEMWRHFNILISVKRARYVMQSMNLVAKRPKKDAYKKQATHKHVCSAHPNHVNQDFKVAPRSIILTDITYLYYGLNRTPIYLCCFKDGYTSEILGHSINLKMNVSLVNTAYENMMAKHKHEFQADTKVYIHSDQGSQYLATSFQELLEDDGFIQSMSARGNSYDNAPIESFFSRMKHEVLDIIARCTSSEIVSELIDGYMHHYNTKRHQMSLAGLSPSEYYQYKTTDIYPLDNYFGIKANKLYTIETLIEQQEGKEQERLEKVKARHQQKERKLVPLSIISKDQNTVMKEIKKWESIALLAKNQLNILNKLKEDISKAIQFYLDSDEVRRKELENPTQWQNYKQFHYIETLNNFL